MMKGKTLDGAYVSAFCMEMHLILQAGIPLSEGIAIFRDDEDQPAVRNILDKLYVQLELGESVAAAMKTAGGFPHYVIEMLTLGQQTGHLEDVFHALAVYYTRQEQMKKSVRNAVMYPAVLLVMMLFVIFVLMIKVLPIFQSVFQQLGIEMSSVAQGMMNMGQWLGTYGLWFVLVGAVMILLFAITSRIPTLWNPMMQKISNLTVNWRLSREMAAARLADALVMTLSSGLDINESLAMSERLLTSPEMLRRVNLCKQAMLEGQSFADASRAAGLFPPLYCRMIAIGFKTGNIDTVMTEISKRSGEIVNDHIESIIGRIEPTLVIVMSVVVGLILLSVMLPLMGIMSAIG